MNKYIAFELMNILVRYLTPKVPIRKNGFAPQKPTARTVGQKEIDIVGRRSFLALLSAVKSHYGDPDYVSKPIPIIADMKSVSKDAMDTVSTWILCISTPTRAFLLLEVILLWCVVPIMSVCSTQST